MSQSTGSRVLMIIGGVVVGMVALSCLAFMSCTMCLGAMGASRSASTPPTAVAAPPSSVPAAVAPAAASAALPPVDLNYDYVLNQTFDLGDFRYRVTGVETEETIGNRFVRERAADGAIFVVVSYDETNLGRETETVMDSSAELRDEEGRSFRPSSRAMTASAMSGRGDYLVAELQPGVTRSARVIFEVPSSVARQAGLTIEMRERGLFGTGRAQVLLVSEAVALGRRVVGEVVEAMIPALRSRDIAPLRTLMVEPERSATDDATLTGWAEAYNAMIDARGDRELTAEYSDSTREGDALALHLKLIPPRGRWRASDGEMIVHTRDAGGRYRLTSLEFHPPSR